MTHLWCILVPFGAYFTVSGIPCFHSSRTKSRLHTKISTADSSEAVCASKIHPSRDFFHAKLKPHHLQTSVNVSSSKITAHLAGNEHCGFLNSSMVTNDAVGMG